MAGMQLVKCNLASLLICLSTVKLNCNYSSVFIGDNSSVIKWFHWTY